MNDAQEATARIALADFEARRKKEVTRNRARHWRFAFMISQVIAGIGLSVYVSVMPWRISGAQACALLFICLAGSAWRFYQARETIASLQSEVERLKDELGEKSA